MHKLIDCLYKAASRTGLRDFAYSSVAMTTRATHDTAPEG